MQQERTLVSFDWAIKYLLRNKAEFCEYSRLSPKERRAYDKYVDVQRGNESSIYTAKLEGEAIGEARGEARGIKKGVLQTAKKMKSEGISVDIISKVTGLSAKEIAKL